ncbi:hypothetical protein [Chryseobacterium sp. A321]
MKKIILIFCLVSCIVSFAQNWASGGDSFESDRLRSVLSKKSVQYNEVEGSVYLNDKFIEAQIKGVEGQWPVRYDAYKDEIEVSKDGEVFVLKKEPEFEEINWIGKGDKARLVSYEDGNKKVLGYLFLVEQTPTYTLYRKDKVNFKEAKQASTPLEIQLPSRFVPSSTTYYIQSGDTFYEIAKKGKGLESLFPEGKKGLSNCVKESKLKENELSSVKAFLKCLPN